MKIRKNSLWYKLAEYGDTLTNTRGVSSYTLDKLDIDICTFRKLIVIGIGRCLLITIATISPIILAVVGYHIFGGFSIIVTSVGVLIGIMLLLILISKLRVAKVWYNEYRYKKVISNIPERSVLKEMYQSYIDRYCVPVEFNNGENDESS